MNGKLLWQCDAVAGGPSAPCWARAKAMTSAAQLASSACDWKFIVQSSQMSPGVLRSPLGPLLYADGWDAYPAARRRFSRGDRPAPRARCRLPGRRCAPACGRRTCAWTRPIPASPIIASEIVTTSVEQPRPERAAEQLGQARQPRSAACARRRARLRLAGHHAPTGADRLSQHPAPRACRQPLAHPGALCDRARPARAAQGLILPSSARMPGAGRLCGGTLASRKSI